ncbi:MAG: Lcl C-terminal domain-containing protein [Burkholderiales bacterium]
MQQLQLPPLNEGEIYIGAIGDKNGDFYHVVLLPGDNDDANWQGQMDWAKSVGGDLPTRIEQAMLWANFRDQLQKDWYWSNEIYQLDDDYAWVQGFTSGNQSYGHKNDSCRARAVRRLPI